MQKVNTPDNIMDNPDKEEFVEDTVTDEQLDELIDRLDETGLSYELTEAILNFILTYETAETVIEFLKRKPHATESQILREIYPEIKRKYPHPDDD